MKLIFLILCFILLDARPQRPPQREGEVRNFKGQKKFSYDNTNLKRAQFNREGQLPKDPVLKYDIELADNFHSLDDEEEIEKVECTKNSIEIYSTKKLNEWKNGDVFVGGEMWECPFELIRKVVSIEYEGKENKLHHYFLKTQTAEMNEMFKSADVDYHFLTQEEVEEQNKVENLKESNLKGSDYSLEIISPEEDTVVDSEVGLEVAFSIHGCTQAKCGDVTVKIRIYANDHIWPISDTLRTTYTTTCTAATGYNCRYLVPMKADGYGYDEEGYVEFKLYKFGDKFIEESVDIMTNDMKFIFELPTTGTIVSMNEAINMTWDCTHATLRKFSTVALKFYREIDWWFDDHVATYYVPTNSYAASYVLRESAGFEKGKTYYVVVDLDNGEEYESSRFTINDGKDSIQLLQPDCTTFVAIGESLHVAWDIKNPLSNKYMKVRVVRSINWWPDDTVWENEKVDSTLGEITIPVSNWRESTKYYIEIEYEAEGDDHKAYSDYFTYADAKRFTVNSVNVNEDSRVVSINMKVNKYAGKYYVSIHQKFPVFSSLDYVINGTDEKEVTEYNVGQSYTHTFKYKQGTPFKAYVQFRYRCLYKGHLCQEEKYYINDIPWEESVFDWNYDINTHNIKERSIALAKYSCSNGMNTENVGPSFTDICNKIPNFDFAFSTTCENCYVFAPVKAFGFELLINKGLAYKARLNVETEMEMNMDVLMTYRGEYHFNHNAPLTDLLSFTIRIPIGPIVIAIKPAMQFFFGFDFDTVIMFEAEAQFTKKYDLLLSFDSTLAKDKQFQVKATDLSPEKPLTAHVAGSVDVYVHPEIVADFTLDCKCAGISFIESALNLKLGVDMKLQAQYPAFPVDYVYSSDYPYYLRLDIYTYLLMTYEVKIFDEVKKSTTNQDLLGDQLKYKFAFAKTKSTNDGITMTVPIKSSYGKLSELQESATAYEIGKLAKSIGEKKGINGISPYLFNAQINNSKTTTTNFVYDYNVLDSSVSQEIISEVEKCITGKGCSVTFDSASYPALYQIKDSIVSN